MLNFTNLEKNKIKDFIRNTIKNPNLELEVRVLSYPNPISQIDFVNVIKKIKSGGFKNVSMDEMTLDIFFKEEDTVRATIHGDNNISKYCNENSFKKILENVEFLEKKRFSLGKVESKPLDLRNYNLRVNLKEEKNLAPKNKSVLDVVSKIATFNKSYRYKKRFSFISPDKLFKYDLTVIKSSSMEEIVKEKKTLPKGEVMDRMLRHVVKPKGVKKAFTDWWDSLGDDQMVTLREQTFMKTKFYKNLPDSNTLTNSLEYEIELEFIGNKSKDSLSGKSLEDKIKDAYTNLETNLVLILQSIQQSEFIISGSDIKNVKNDFYQLTKFARFTDSMPNPVTLERENIVDNPGENTVNIRRNYSVTEKTDGERNLLFIDSIGKVFLINRMNKVRNTGVMVENYTNTLIDGELVTKNINGQDMNLYLCFDLYFSNKKDFRDRILMRSMLDRGEDGYEKSRLEELEDFINTMVLHKEECNLEFIIERKVFKYGNVEELGEDYDKLAEEREEYILNHGSEITEESLRKLRQDINLAKQNTKIFEEAQKILIQIEANQYNYNTDGLIFTPIYQGIGEGERKKNIYGGRWSSLLKWKPIEENSIDFLVKIQKNETGENVEKYITIGNDLISYRKMNLLVGYDKHQHKYLNGFRVLNEDISYLDGYNVIPFEPLHPFANKIYEANVRLEANGLVCKNGDLIRDNSIIEFSYDKNANHGFNWIPLRARDNLVPNAFSTACNVWHSTFNPITTEMISTGNNIPKNYYGSGKKTGSMNQVYKFHNQVKSLLIQQNCKKGDRVMELGCGEMGDLLKYVPLEIDMLVGIDYDKHNLINSNKGAIKRILDLRDRLEKENTPAPFLNNTFALWGDCSKNLANGDAGMDSLNRFYLDVLWGNVINRKHIERLGNPRLKAVRGKCQGKFDIISCQFAFHYFFRDSSSLNEYLLNVSENLVIGGKFLATFFDGRKIFKLLESNSKVERKTPEGKLLWRIDKKYKNKTFPNNVNSISVPIEVYMETFGSSFEEYLVNLDYLRELFELYGMEITSIKPFEEYHKELKGDLSDEQKLLSFLNVSLVVTKKKEIIEMKGGGEEKNPLDIFLSKKEQLGGDLELEEDILDEDTEYTDNEGTDTEEQTGGDTESEVDNTDEETGSEAGEIIEESEAEDTGSEAGEIIEEAEAEVEEITGGGIEEAEAEAEAELVLEEKPLSVKEDPEIVRLDDIYLGPDLSDQEVDLMTDGKTEDIGSLNLDEVDFGDIGNENIGMELSELNSSILNLKKDRMEDVIIAPEAERKVDSNVKVIKLSV